MYYDLNKGCCKSLCLTVAHKQKCFKITKTKITLGKQAADNQKLVASPGREVQYIYYCTINEYGPAEVNRLEI